MPARSDCVAVSVTCSGIANCEAFPRGRREAWPRAPKPWPNAATVNSHRSGPRDALWLRAVSVHSSGTLDTMKLKIAVENSVGKTLSTRQLAELIEKFDSNNDNVLDLEEFTKLCHDAESLGEGNAEAAEETLGDDFYDVDFNGEKLGMSVKDGPNKSILVSRVTSQEIQGTVNPNDVMYAINGVKLSRVSDVTSHSELAAKLSSIRTRPIRVTFQRAAQL